MDKSVSSPDASAPDQIEIKQQANAVVGTESKTHALEPFLNVWRLFSANKKALAGIWIVLFFVIVAVVGPLFVKGDPQAFSSDILLPPSADHWLGTTQTGQDLFVQMIIGTRSSIFWGVVTGLLVTFLSITIGLTAGYFGGVVDDVLSMLTNVFLVIPSLPLTIVIAAFSPIRGPLTVAIVIAFTSWAWGARVLRAQTLSMRERDFVTASRASGEKTLRVIFTEILPNEISIVAAGFVGTMNFVILAAVALEFLGLGDATVISWGSILYWAQNNSALLLGAWWWFLPPGLCVAILGAGLSLINYGIDEIANPRLRSDLKPKFLKKFLKGGAA